MNQSMKVPVKRRTLLTAAGLGIGASMLGGEIAYADPRAVVISNGMVKPAAWAEYLANLDLRWGRIPQNFYDGPFLGNGGLGASVYQVNGKLAFTINDSRVRDHQSAGGSTWGWARLRIGRLDLTTVGQLTDVDLRLSLFDAQLRGTITTTKGTIDITAFVDSVRDVLVIRTKPSSGERVDWQFTPFEAKSPRYQFQSDYPDGMLTNPEPIIGPDRVIQNLAAGGGHTTMWRKQGGVLTLTVATDRGSRHEAKANKTLTNAPWFGDLNAEHREWWRSYYTKSFVSVPDARIQSFYWIQLYKLASATRAGLPPVGTAAIWLEPTPWPAAWWNLNVQLEVLADQRHQPLRAGLADLLHR